jgi:hypothetical protein
MAPASLPDGNTSPLAHAARAAATPDWRRYGGSSMSELFPTPPAASFDRTRDLPRLEEVAQDLAAVEAALGRLDDDTYGRCRICGEEISDSRLAQFPATDDCGEHPGSFAG